MKKDTTEATLNDLEGLLHTINTHYEGNFIEVCQDIDNAIYLLHYLCPQRDSTTDLLNVCFTLKKLREGLYKAHRGSQLT